MCFSASLLAFAPSGPREGSSLTSESDSRPLAFGGLGANPPCSAPCSVRVESCFSTRKKKKSLHFSSRLK